MKVKELKDFLIEFDQGQEVVIAILVEGSDAKLTKIQSVGCLSNYIVEDKRVLLIAAREISSILQNDKELMKKVRGQKWTN